MPASRPRRIDSIPSASGGLARLVCERLREEAIPLAPLLSKAGLSAEQIDNSSVRVEARSQVRILDLAADALQDDFLDSSGWRIRPARNWPALLRAGIFRCHERCVAKGCALRPDHQRGSYTQTSRQQGSRDHV